MEINVNGKPTEVPDGISLRNFLDEVGINRQHVAVELNATLVPREQHEQCVLSHGDRLEIVTLVGGG